MLLLRSRYSREVIFPKASGIEPCKLRLRSKYLRDVTFPKVSGLMGPSNWLDETSRRTKLPLKVDKKF
ncbi:LOW QUALITY PROTEIN: hypothetical protein TorRG33x02_031630 [Trema orientale]|uniref:Uncharacterized protein n=1 Tax=Trema orientale TaxID=63057 RepID=A0A2P5FT74_TREOI|nr:LOW QUALITY PROTEIN: hypothetical protein TorRG33x02_031630 [Trema orientale]